MKPTQEQILSALNKLIRENKTELKTEKVELSVVNDLKVILKSSEKLKKESKANLKSAESFNKQSVQLLKKQETLDKELVKAEKSAKKVYKTISNLLVVQKN